MEGAIHAVVDLLQDFVIETMHDRWPATPDPSVLRDPIPTLHVLHEGRRFRIFFGPRYHPVLELDPIIADAYPLTLATPSFHAVPMFVAVVRDRYTNDPPPDSVEDCCNY